MGYFLVFISYPFDKTYRSRRPVSRMAPAHRACTAFPPWGMQTHGKRYEAPKLGSPEPSAIDPRSMRSRIALMPKLFESSFKARAAVAVQFSRGIPAIHFETRTPPEIPARSVLLHSENTENRFLPERVPPHGGKKKREKNKGKMACTARLGRTKKKRVKTVSRRPSLSERS